MSDIRTIVFNTLFDAEYNAFPDTSKSPEEIADNLSGMNDFESVSLTVLIQHIAEWKAEYVP